MYPCDGYFDSQSTFDKDSQGISLKAVAGKTTWKFTDQSKDEGFIVHACC
jgi:hypothetical protein